MSKPSANSKPAIRKSAKSKTVRKSASDLTPARASDLARLRKAMKAQVDTSEIAEATRFEKLQRDADGALPRRRSMVRDAIEQQRVRQQITVYRLWQRARAFHPGLSQAAVHEFLNGRRQLELPSAEALLMAVNLGIAETHELARNKPRNRNSLTEPRRPRSRV